MGGGQVLFGALDGFPGAAVNDDLGALAQEKRGGRLSDTFAGDEAVFVAPETPTALSGAVSMACVVFSTIPDSRTRLPGRR
jgi:hypothetical protein